MAYILIRHNVETYGKWRLSFDEGDSARRDAGALGTPQIFRSGDNPFGVMVLIEWEEMEKARKFADSNEFRESITKSGVTDEPTIFFLQEV